MIARPNVDGNRCAAPEPTLYDLLVGLGFDAEERIPICSQSPGRKDQFRSELYAVGDLAGWSPPQDRCVWFGANPVARRVRKRHKGGEADITRARTLFADFDIKPGKCLDTLEQCYTAASGLADYLDTGPTALIESGHGLQPLWRVGSPRGDSNVVDRDWSRLQFRETWWRFGALALNAAREATWSVDGSQNLRTIDGVFNIDRILRCPGSINWKDPDNPVPVSMRLLGGGRIRLRELVARLDRDGVQPLRRTRETVPGVPTDFEEATEWIEAQNGATADRAELDQLPRTRVLGAYLDPVQVADALADGSDGVHATMRDKVLHAVYSAQEGKAGLVLALQTIGEAYLNVMAARAEGELVGEARDVVTATREWQNAVRGAVGKARGRKLPNVSRWGAGMAECAVYGVGRKPRMPRMPR